MDKYVFSGSLTREMVDFLKAVPEFEPMDVLVSQVDRNGVNQMLKYKKEDGIIKSFFLDSGAFSIHTGKAKLDLQDYIDYANSLDEHTFAYAQLDTIPGKFGQPKSKKDYEESAEKSWENYLYMRKFAVSPEKIVPVFHFGESFDALRRMLDWRDENGNPLTYIGISPANDTAQYVKNIYLREVYDVIKHSNNPTVKTHLFGMTSLDALSKFPCYSADSISHRLRSAYGKVFTRKWGVISLSDRSRTTKTKRNMSFISSCDKRTLDEFKELLSSYNMTIEQLKESSSARLAFDILETQKAVKNEYRYHPDNTTKSKKLFCID